MGVNNIVIKKSRILNIATFPPPIGGVSYFLRRLKSYTDIDKKKQFIYVDVSGKNIKKKRQEGIKCYNKISVFFFLLFTKPSLVVFHSNSFGHLFLHLIFKKKHSFIYLTHGESILKKKNQSGWRYNILSKAKAIITPTEELYVKTKRIFNNNCLIKYIPFIIYPRNVSVFNSTSFEQLRKNTDFIFSGYANSLITYNNNELYGIDMMIELIHTLNCKGYNVGIAILITNINDKQKFDEYLSLIKKYEIENKIVFLTEAFEEASSLYIATDAYLRPTNTDGDSFSIWEALHFCIPVLTSDATQRPKGCVLFKNRNQADLEKKAIGLINGYAEIKKSVQDLKIQGNEKEMIQFLAEMAIK